MLEPDRRRGLKAKDKYDLVYFYALSFRVHSLLLLNKNTQNVYDLINFIRIQGDLSRSQTEKVSYFQYINLCRVINKLLLKYVRGFRC